ncbi:hypothetical protein AMECASPLE_033554, partial [Ameca splendens]
GCLVLISERVAAAENIRAGSEKHSCQRAETSQELDWRHHVFRHVMQLFNNPKGPKLKIQPGNGVTADFL